MAVRRSVLIATHAAACSLLLVLSVVASADAAKLTTDACVRTYKGVGKVPIAGTGFTPGALISIRSNPPGVVSTVMADPAGTFSMTVPAPRFNPFARQLQAFALTATDTINPGLTAKTSYKQVRLAYTSKPSTGSPTRQVTHVVSGFTPGKSTYLHFRLKGRTQRNVTLGKADSPCGIASRRMALLPTTSRPGLWSVYADQAPVFSPTTVPQLAYTFVIKRVPR